MKTVSLQSMPLEARQKLLAKLDLRIDGDFVISARDGSVHRDVYTGAPIRADNMLVVPGSVLVLDNSDVSIACYLEDPTHKR